MGKYYEHDTANFSPPPHCPAVAPALTASTDLNMLALFDMHGMDHMSMSALFSQGLSIEEEY